MTHVAVMGLVLTLVAGMVSFAVLLRTIQAQPSRLPASLATSLLLYNVWVAAWLITAYLGSYVVPSLRGASAGPIASALRGATSLVALAWLLSLFMLIDEFLESNASRRARRGVQRVVYGSMGTLVALWAIGIVSPAAIALFRAVHGAVGDLLFPAALGGSVLLLAGVRREPDTRVRRALTILSRSYVTLFSLLAALVLVAWKFRLASAPVLLTADLVLELAYNTLMVVWVVGYADAFAFTAPSQGEAARSFTAQCERFKISKREGEIIALVCQGLTNQEIADRLFISLGTVKDHNHTIFQKTAVRNRTQLAKLFMRPAGSVPEAQASSGASNIRRVV